MNRYGLVAAILQIINDLPKEIQLQRLELANVVDGIFREPLHLQLSLNWAKQMMDYRTCLCLYTDGPRKVSIRCYPNGKMEFLESLGHPYPRDLKLKIHEWLYNIPFQG